MGSPTLKSDALRRILRENVKSLLVKMDMSENQLAIRSNVSQKQINNLTNGRTGCGIDAVAAIAKALHVEPWELLKPKFGNHYVVNNHPNVAAKAQR